MIYDLQNKYKANIRLTKQLYVVILMGHLASHRNRILHFPRGYFFAHEIEANCQKSHQRTALDNY